jgi:hypothetical protein
MAMMDDRIDQSIVSEAFNTQCWSRKIELDNPLASSV